MWSNYNVGHMRQLFAGFTGGLGILIVGTWTGWPSPFQHKLSTGEIPYNLTAEQRSWVVSLLNFGDMISPIPAGYIMDLFGRKPTFFVTAIIFQISWLLTTFATGADLLYVSRFLAGIAEGITFTVSPLYLAEIAETRIRGAISGLFSVLMTSGTIFEFLIGRLCSYLTLNIASSIIPMIYFACIVIIPESPHYLLMRHNRTDANKSYSWLRNSKSQKGKDDTSIEEEMDVMNSQVQKEMESRGEWLDLLRTKGTRRATFIVMTLSIMQRFGGISTMKSYMSTTLPSNGGIGPEECMIIFAFLLLITSILGMFIVEWLGRKPALFISGIVCSILQLIIAFYFYLDSKPNYDMTHLQWIPDACILSFAVFFQAGIGGLCLLIVGTWAGWPSPFQYKLKMGEIPFNLTRTERSWVVSLLDFGNIISPIPAGYMMDRFGRKSTFLLTAIVFQISWLLAIFANGANLLYVARLLSGIGKGIAFTVSPMYLAEIAETKIRGAVSGLFTVLLFMGTIYEFVIGLLCSYYTLNIASSIIPIIFFICVIIIPESPHYLLMKNNLTGAYKSYCWLRNPKRETQYGGETIEHEMDVMNSQVQKEMESRGEWLDLLRTKGTRRATFIVMTLSAMQRFGGINSMISYMSTTLPSNGGFFGPEECMIIFALLLLITSLVCMFIVDWLGRKPALLVSGIVCAILQGIIAFYFYLDSKPNYDITHLQWIPYACMLTFAVFYQAGSGIMPHTLLGEMFPANVKSKAAAAATICFALSTFLLNKIFPIIQQTYGVQFMFILFSVTNALVAIFTHLFVIETKGKSFGEIQDILNG
ncbi:facilitated trehalose transporter Tret1-2 homolog [Lycorma delicatula]|uniref:facilitated trehalose transporter Tret1-2 homolog n=1 Tax=Lycorma delicatula TaxID=130591 RepID=UPI003F51682F